MSYENRELPGSTGMGIFFAFLAGAAVGAVAALLTTSKTGPEMRATLRHWAQGFGDGDQEQHARERERAAAPGFDRPVGS